MPLRYVLVKGLKVTSMSSGSRKEIAEAFSYVANGSVRCNIEMLKLEQVDDAISRLQKGQVLGRLVVDLNL